MNVDIADNFYYDCIREVEDIGRPVLKSVEQIKVQKDLLHLINMKVVKFIGTDGDLIVTCKNVSFLVRFCFITFLNANFIKSVYFLSSS